MTSPRRRRKPDRKVHFSDPSEFPPIWMLKEDLRTVAQFDRLLARDGTLGVRNDDDVSLRKREIRIASGRSDLHELPLPDDFPPILLVMADADYAPDYFSFGRHEFCSRRLRDILAQPPEVLQFLPVDLVAGGEAVRVQDYRRMHLLAQQPVMDMDRSEYKVNAFFPHIPETTLKSVDWVDLFVLLEGFQPRTEIFRPDETTCFTLVTDALAARVLHSGCTGMTFRDPITPIHGMRVDRYRTTTGIAERRVGFLD